MKNLILVLAVATGCSASHGGLTGIDVLASTENVSPESIAAFEATVYAFGQNNACVKCHGGTVNPRWLHREVATAYSFARPLLDLANPSASVFATYVANRHCNDSACTNAANIPIMQDLLLQWAAIELNQSGNGLPPAGGTTLANPPFVTAAMPVPANLPLITAGLPAVIRFELSQLAPSVPALAGAVLELSIAAYNSAGTTYKIFDPRIVGAAGPVSVTGMHVYVRAAVDTGLGLEFVNQGCVWSGMNAIAAPVARPIPLPAGPITAALPLANTSLAIPVQSLSDVITIGFVNIR